MARKKTRLIGTTHLQYETEDGVTIRPIEQTVLRVEEHGYYIGDLEVQDAVSSSTYYDAIDALTKTDRGNAIQKVCDRLMNMSIEMDSRSEVEVIQGCIDALSDLA